MSRIYKLLLFFEFGLAVFCFVFASHFGKVLAANCAEESCPYDPGITVWDCCSDGFCVSSLDNFKVSSCMSSDICETGCIEQGHFYWDCTTHEPLGTTCTSGNCVSTNTYIDEVCYGWNALCASSYPESPYCACVVYKQGDCPGNGNGGPTCGCDLRNLTCPATCQRDSTFQVSYEAKSSLASGCYVYQALLGHQFSPLLSWAVKLWCNDDIYYGNDSWNLQTKTLNCNDMINTGGPNLEVGCYGDNDNVYAGEQWCDYNDGMPGPPSDWLFCKVDGICEADTNWKCCESYAWYNMPDANSSTGALPNRTCQGATWDSCWGPRGGFSFPDTQAGELYNDSCCGDDTEEYFVSDFGVFQAGSQLSAEDRSCDGTTACCRHTGAGIYPGFVDNGLCIASCPIVSIGHIRVQGPSGIIKLNLISVAEAVTRGKGTVKVALPGGVVGAADLVEIGGDTSPVRVYTGVGANGIKVWRKIE